MFDRLRGSGRTPCANKGRDSERTTVLKALKLGELYSSTLMGCNNQNLSAFSLPIVCRCVATTDRKSCVQACHGLKLDNQQSPALTVPIVNRPEKLPLADLTRRTDTVMASAMGNMITSLLTVSGLKDGGDWWIPSRGKRATMPEINTTTM